MALHGKKIGFEKIIKLIDDLVATLKKEQVDDDAKKEYCEAQFDMTEDKIKGLQRSIEDTKTVIENAKEGIATSISEAKALQEGIVALDKAVAEATEQRKEENADYKELMAGNAAAKELLLFAKNRLNKFYNPKLYKAPPKAELSAEDKISSSFSLLQLKKDAPPPPPESFKAYSKKGEESNGVITMIDMLVADLEKEMTVAETEEKNAQEDYEMTMKDSAEKRAQDTKSLTDKEAMKAELEGELESAKTDLKATANELMATDKYMASLHAECDWLMQYFDVRKEARVGEIDALTKAKAVLNGADYSLLQILRRAF
jgi:chromosome segregation ATPase